MGTNEPEILRSIEDRHKAFIRFINTTSYPIEVLWINYHGQAVRYSILQPLGTLDINTFATHPWIFVEHETRDRFIAAGKDVFFPQPWFTRYLGMSRDQLPEHISRVEVHITLPIYSLRDISLRAIKRLLRHDLHAFSLDIPKSLQCELASMLPRKVLVSAPVSRPRPCPLLFFTSHRSSSCGIRPGCCPVTDSQTRDANEKFRIHITSSLQAVRPSNSRYAYVHETKLDYFQHVDPNKTNA
ncbi:hypothetical protein G9C98_004019 [Cotesia typhae]|uniref:von Hippel-Lindau disease tumour suppressor beta domain-containing protein n=1 Tax=Cotesia typhae TaxID=2053667 RepID=A0A8J5QY90_9HYME|nr:hypothetical protein G9C98_004019 [Cotesia typhae]